MSTFVVGSLYSFVSSLSFFDWVLFVLCVICFKLRVCVLLFVFVVVWGILFCIVFSFGLVFFDFILLSFVLLSYGQTITH